MLLGVPYHAGLFFRGESSGLDAVVSFSTHFRMPAFFFIAGVFAVLLLERRGVTTWWSGRVRRLGIPLIFAVAVLSPIQTLILKDGDWKALSIKTYHAWFLLYLLIYCAILALAWRVARVRSLAKTAGAWATRGPGQYLVTIAVLSVGTVVISTAWFVLRIDERSGGLLGLGLPSQFAEFLIGVLVAAAPGTLDRLSTWARLPVAVIAIIGSCILLTDATSIVLPGVVAGAANFAIAGVTGMAWAAILLLLFRAGFDRASITVRWVVDASLTVYLVHNVLIYAFGPVVASWDLHAVASSVALTLLALLGSLIAYELANSFRLGRLLTTGHTKRGASASALLTRKPSTAPDEQPERHQA